MIRREAGELERGYPFSSDPGKFAFGPRRRKQEKPLLFDLAYDFFEQLARSRIKPMQILEKDYRRQATRTVHQQFQQDRLDKVRALLQQQEFPEDETLALRARRKYGRPVGWKPAALIDVELTTRPASFRPKSILLAT